MNAPPSFRERHAMQLHRKINEDFQADPFDRDYDPSEVPAPVLPKYHPSFEPAAIQPVPVVNVDLGAKTLAELRAKLPKVKQKKHCTMGESHGVEIPCWHDTPELYRRMVVAAAGVSADVVAKIDRELSEAEKAEMRKAISNIRLFMNSLVTL